MEKPILVFQTDFTYKEGAVSAMYGVVKSVDRSLEIFTGSHEIPHFDAWSASYRLWQTVRFWPKGTVFVSVVDPGVGTDRIAAAAKTKDGYYIFTPDNGTLTHLAATVGLDEVRAIDYSLRRPQGAGSSVFDGRDLFAYVAARFASGELSFVDLGPAYAVDDVITFPLPTANWDGKALHGYFEIADPNFGNLWSNITVEDFESAGFMYGDTFSVTIYHDGQPVYEQKLPYQKAFGDVPKGMPLLYTNELCRISLALCEDNILDKHHLGFGPKWTVSISK